MPDSLGPVAIDQAGSGYPAWGRAGNSGGADVPMFCKPPGERRCSHPMALGLPTSSARAAANALAPFPILPHER